MNKIKQAKFSHNRKSSVLLCNVLMRTPEHCLRVFSCCRHTGDSNTLSDQRYFPLVFSGRMNFFSFDVSVFDTTYTTYTTCTTYTLLSLYSCHNFFIFSYHRHRFTHDFSYYSFFFLVFFFFVLLFFPFHLLLLNNSSFLLSRISSYCRHLPLLSYIFYRLVHLYHLSYTFIYFLFTKRPPVLFSLSLRF